MKFTPARPYRPRTERLLKERRCSTSPWTAGSQSCAILANMTENEKQCLLRTVAERHASLSEFALKFRRELPSNAKATEPAIMAEGVALQLRRAHQQLEVEDREHVAGRERLRAVREA